jgi:hypothetical protein
MLLGLWACAWASQADDGRYQAFPLPSSGGKGDGRAFIIDTRDGNVWIWSENELIAGADGHRRYGAGFIYQGRLRPGTQPGEFLETPEK